MNRRRFEVVRTNKGWHARVKGGNSKIIMSSESYKTKASAHKAVRAIAEMFSEQGMVWEMAGYVSISLDGDVNGLKRAIPVLEVDER